MVSFFGTCLQDFLFLLPIALFLSFFFIFKIAQLINKQKVTIMLKRFQNWCGTHQNSIFFCVLILIFTIVNCILPLDQAIFGLLFFCMGGFLMYLLLQAFPQALQYAFAALFVLRIFFGTISYPFAALMLGTWAALKILIVFDLFKPFTDFIEEIKISQKQEEFHKSNEFFLWGFLEKFSLVFLVFLVLYKALVENLDYRIADSLRLYAYVIMFFSFIINIIILNAFNPPKPGEAKIFIKVAKNCLYCAGSASTVYIAGDTFVDRCTNPLKDPGTSRPVVLYQTYNLGCTAPTGEHLKALSTHTKTYGHLPPLVPGTNIVDLTATNDKFLQEKNPVYQNRIKLYDNRFKSTFNVDKEK